MPDILLTNDDGYRSAGFGPLHAALCKSYDVLAVTPVAEKSWIGKAITAKKELSAKTVSRGGRSVYTVTGTPADCVQLGLYHIAVSRPKLVVAGINLGTNASVPRILSSGTVGAGMEAAIAGVKAICVSLIIPMTVASKTDLYSKKAMPMFESAVEITLKVVDKLIDRKFGPGFDVLSVNIPFSATVDSKLELTRPDTESYGSIFKGKNNKYRLDGKVPGRADYKKGTDLSALSRGNISITPISLSLTTEDAIRSAENLFEEF